MRARWRGPATIAFIGVAAGLLVVTVVGIVRDMNTYDAGLDGHYRRTDDPRKVIVSATVGRDDEIAGSSTREDAGTVAITVRARRTNTGPGFSDLVGYMRTVTVTLQDPLGQRRVVDARTGYRMQDEATSIERREVGVIEAGSFAMTDGTIDLRWTDSKGTHAFKDLRGSTVVLLTRGPTFTQQSDSKMSMLALEGTLANASDARRAATRVFVVSFDRANATAPDDAPFRALFVDPIAVGPEAPEILQASAPSVLWVLGPDGRLRQRLAGVVTPLQVASALEAAR